MILAPAPAENGPGPGPGPFLFSGAGAPVIPCVAWAKCALCARLAHQKSHKICSQFTICSLTGGTKVEFSRPPSAAKIVKKYIQNDHFCHHLAPKSSLINSFRQFAPWTLYYWGVNLLRMALPGASRIDRDHWARSWSRCRTSVIFQVSVSARSRLGNWSRSR